MMFNRDISSLCFDQKHDIILYGCKKIFSGAWDSIQIIVLKIGGEFQIIMYSIKHRLGTNSF